MTHSNRRLPASALGLAVCWSAIVGTAPAAAVNLIVNPGFDADLAGWVVTTGSHVVAWSEADELGGSGSLEVTGPEQHRTVTVWSSCLPIAGGETYAFGGSFRATGGDSPANGYADFRFFADAGCSGLNETVQGDLRTYFGRSTWGPAQGHAVAPAWATTARLLLWIVAGPEPPDAVTVDNAFVHPGETCAETASTLCLAGDRFRVHAEWRVPDGTEGTARVQALTADSGYLWFFAPDNVEAVVKVLDGCAVYDRFWVFSAGLTDVGVDLTVADTVAGQTWSASNPLGQPFAPIQDTDAFATCGP